MGNHSSFHTTLEHVAHTILLLYTCWFCYDNQKQRVHGHCLTSEGMPNLTFAFCYDIDCNFQLKHATNPVIPLLTITI